MWDAAVDIAVALGRALAGVADSVAGAAPEWLVLGVLLHLGNQLTRGRAWYAIVRAATDDDPDLRRRDAMSAWIAGAGVGGIASGRGGDAVRLLLLAPRLPRAGAPLLAGTLVAEGVGELILGTLIVVLAVAVGIRPQLEALAAAAPYALAGLVLVGVAFVALRRVAALRRLSAKVACGCAPLRSPGGYIRHVLPWQTASRTCRAGALACFLAAFGMPVTPAAVLLVMLAQGSGRLLPFAPASAAAGVAMLAATFGPVTGSTVPVSTVAAFFFGTGTALTVVGLVLAAAICARSPHWPAVAAMLRFPRRRTAPVEA
jgi:hypothetical protein